MYKYCLVCGKKFAKRERVSLSEWKRRKYCSRSCQNKDRVGEPSTKKGKHYPHLQGENHYAWKGDDVGYFALHSWLRRTKGSPDRKCTECSSTTAKRYEWANISGEYKRDATDYRSLCKSCHQKETYKKGEQKVNNGAFKKGMTPWHKGKKTGLIPKSAFKKGFTPWNKGKTLSAEHRKKLSESHKGNVPWNKKTG